MVPHHKRKYRRASDERCNRMYRRIQASRLEAGEPSSQKSSLRSWSQATRVMGQLDDAASKAREAYAKRSDARIKRGTVLSKSSRPNSTGEGREGWTQAPGLVLNKWLLPNMLRELYYCLHQTFAGIGACRKARVHLLRLVHTRQRVTTGRLVSATDYVTPNFNSTTADPCSHAQ